MLRRLPGLQNRDSPCPCFPGRSSGQYRRDFGRLENPQARLTVWSEKSGSQQHATEPRANPRSWRIDIESYALVIDTRKKRECLHGP